MQEKEYGPVAQLGERYYGIVEAGRAELPGSTNLGRGAAQGGRLPRTKESSWEHYPGAPPISEDLVKHELVITGKIEATCSCGDWFFKGILPSAKKEIRDVHRFHSDFHSQDSDANKKGP